MKNHSFCIAALLATSLQAQVFVDDDAPAGGNGASWATAYNDLNDALNNSGAGALILIAEGTYRARTAPVPPGQATMLADATFAVGPNVTMIGGFLGNEVSGTPLGKAGRTVLTGEVVPGSSVLARHVVTVTGAANGTTTIQRVKIVDGDAVGAPGFGEYGGGILYTAPQTGSSSGGHTLELRDVRVRNCSAARAGGAVFVEGGTLNAYRCKLINNTAGVEGGGVYMRYHGSGQFSQHSHIYNTLFRLNSAVGDGGGCMVDTPQDLWVQDPRVRFMNCVFDRNAAGSDGGGLRLAAWGASDIANCSFGGNAAAAGGGLSMAQGHGVPEIQTRLWNCITWGNSASYEPEFDTFYAATFQCGDLPVVIANNDTANSVITTPICGATIANNFYVDPLFANPGAGNLRISPRSFCVNTGTRAFFLRDYFDADGDGDVNEAMPVDYNGEARVKGGEIDRGAFEATLAVVAR